jgi:hypothetical protein
MANNKFLFNEFLADQIAVIYGHDWSGDPDNYVKSAALNVQSLTLLDHLRKALYRCLDLSSQMTAPRALYFIRYGAVRRLKMIWQAYHNLVSTVPSDRTEPLTSDESGDLTNNINTIYLNIRGVMDNLCWALLYELAPDMVTSESFRPMKVGLFQPLFSNEQRFVDLVGKLRSHKTWHDDLKSRRDPAAHQIPLYIPPQIVTPLEAAEYQNFFGDFLASAVAGDSAGADALDQRLERIGRFVPYFAHDPDQEPMPIYPTVSDDVGHLISIFETVDAFMSAVETGENIGC